VGDICAGKEKGQVRRDNGWLEADSGVRLQEESKRSRPRMGRGGRVRLQEESKGSRSRMGRRGRVRLQEKSKGSRPRMGRRRRAHQIRPLIVR
jgi:hypothetical protein